MSQLLQGNDTATRRDALDARRKQLDEEIRGYPTPIPRCDAQLNHLYEERARIIAELEVLGPQA